MRAGELRRRVTIEQATETQNALGEPIKSWATFATVWAHFEPLNGRERIEAAAINAQLNTRVTIRYLAGVDVKMRIIYGSRTFQIQSVMNLDERNRTIELLCIEGQ